MRKFEASMPKSEWVVPSLEVGDIAVILHSYSAHAEDANFTDIICGDTRVLEVKKNGSVVLANGFKFHANGYGHARNAACVISTHHALDRTPNGFLPEDAFTGKTITRPAIRAGHFLTFANGPY